jgi:hypothetical protein
MAEPKILPNLEVELIILKILFYENSLGMSFGGCLRLEIKPNRPSLPSTGRGNLALPVVKATASSYLFSTIYSSLRPLIPLPDLLRLVNGQNSKPRDST